MGIITVLQKGEVIKVFHPDGFTTTINPHIPTRHVRTGKIRAKRIIDRLMACGWILKDESLTQGEGERID